MMIATILEVLRNPGSVSDEKVRQSMIDAAELIESLGGGFPIPGTSGLAVKAALKRLALLPTNAKITIHKERMREGHYVYLIEQQTMPPAVAVRPAN